MRSKQKFYQSSIAAERTTQKKNGVVIEKRVQFCMGLVECDSRTRQGTGYHARLSNDRAAY